jgi:hypothetical protein
MQNEEITVEYIARLFKYYTQDVIPNVTFKRELNNVQVKTFITKNKKYLEKLTNIIIKYKINPDTFIRYAVIENGLINPKLCLNIHIFQQYAYTIQRREQYVTIFNKYMKTVNFIAEQCILNKISPEKYILNMIFGNNLAYEYISGRVSKHFISTIPNIANLFYKMDSLNRDELSIIFNALGELEIITQEAFMYNSSERAKPIDLIKKQINKLSNKLTNKQTSN